MKILVSVGTGRFDTLVSLFENSNLDCVIQYGSGSPSLKKESFSFVDNFSSLVSEFDYIVTHCGAGNIYGMLLRGHKLVVVPNLERSDSHQLELFEYLKENSFCACLKIEELEGMVDVLPSWLADFEKNPGFRPYYRPNFDLNLLLADN